MFSCRLLGPHRSTRPNVPQGQPIDDRLTANIIELATRYGLHR
jgi:hypothetical protein